MEVPSEDPDSEMLQRRLTRSLQPVSNGQKTVAVSLLLLCPLYKRHETVLWARPHLPRPRFIAFRAVPAKDDNNWHGLDLIQLQSNNAPWSGSKKWVHSFQSDVFIDPAIYYDNDFTEEEWQDWVEIH